MLECCSSSSVQQQNRLVEMQSFFCQRDTLQSLLRDKRPVSDSFIQDIFLAPLQVHSTTQRRSRHSTNAVSKFHAKAPQTTASEGLVQESTWRSERDSNSRPFGRKSTTLPMSHHIHVPLLSESAFPPSRLMPESSNQFQTHHY